MPPRKARGGLQQCRLHPTKPRRPRRQIDVVDLEGEGIFSDAFDWAKKRLPKWLAPDVTSYTKPSAATLAKYGSRRIENIVVFRKPIASGLDKAINLISFGKFDEVKKKMGYEKMFHLGTVVTLDDGTELIVEKLQTINVSPGGVPSGSEVVDAPIAKHPTLFQFLEDTRRMMGDALYFGYQALPLDGKPANNCQVFVDSLLTANGAITPEIRAFVVQDVSEFASELSPATRDTMQFITDLGATAQRITGMGVRGRRRRVRRTELEALLDDILG